MKSRSSVISDTPTLLRKINMSEQGQAGKAYDPQDTTLKFVDRTDELDPLCKMNNLSH